MLSKRFNKIAVLVLAGLTLQGCTVPLDEKGQVKFTPYKQDPDKYSIHRANRPYRPLAAFAGCAVKTPEDTEKTVKKFVAHTTYNNGRIQKGASIITDLCDMLNARDHAANPDLHKDGQNPLHLNATLDVDHQFRTNTALLSTYLYDREQEKIEKATANLLNDPAYKKRIPEKAGIAARTQYTETLWKKGINHIREAFGQKPDIDVDIIVSSKFQNRDIGFKRIPDGPQKVIASTAPCRPAAPQP